MNRENPCNCCWLRGRCGILNNSCVFNTWGGNNHCTNYECMLHYEDSCLVGVEDKCGSNPSAIIEWDDEEEEEE